MSALDDLIDAGLNVGVMALSQHVGKEAEKSLAQALERKDFWGILFSAGVYGASAYVYQTSATKLARLAGKYQRALPRYDLRSIKSRKTPIWYLPKKNRKSGKSKRA
jgi:hypothetical protein